MVTGGAKSSTSGRSRDWRAWRRASTTVAVSRTSVSTPMSDADAGEEVGRARGGALQGDERAGRDAGRLRHRVLAVAAADLVLASDHVGHGAEGEPLGLQPWDQSVEGGDGLGAVTAAVVQQDDGPVAGLGRGLLHDPVDAGPRPVAAVEVAEHEEVAIVGDLGQLLPVLLGDRPDGRRVRRPEQRGADPRPADQRRLGERQLEPQLHVVEVGDVAVAVGVRPDLVALVLDPTGERGVLGDPRAEHEEGARHVVAVEHVEDLRRPGRVGPVVEGEHHRPGRGVDRPQLAVRAGRRSTRPRRAGRLGGGPPRAQADRCPHPRRGCRSRRGPTPRRRGRAAARAGPSGPGEGRGGDRGSSVCGDRSGGGGRAAPVLRVG